MLNVCLNSGSDFYDGFIHVSRRNVRRPNQNTLYLRSDIRQLPRYFKPGSLDTLFVHDVLGHEPLSEAASLLGLMMDLVKSGGVVEVRVPDLPSLVQQAAGQDACELSSRFLFGDESYPLGYRKAAFSQRWLQETLSELSVSQLNFTIDSVLATLTARGCKN